MKNKENIFNLDFNNRSTIAKDDSQLISEKDLENARADSFSKGYSRGFEEGAVRGQLKAITKNEQKIEDTFIKIYMDISSLLKKEFSYEENLPDTILKISMAIVKKVLPHYTSKYGADEMEHAIRYILSTLLDDQDITIFISSDAMNDICERIADIQICFPNKLTLLNDDSLKESECRVDWKGGGARWSQPDLLESIQELFTHFVKSADLDKEAKQ